MARMNEVLKSFQDLQSEDKPKTEQTSDKRESAFVGFSGLDAIKKAITENLGGSPTPAKPSSESIRAADLARTPADFPKISSSKSSTPSESELKAIQTQDENAANQLYMELHRVFGNVVQGIKDKKSLDPKSLEKYILSVYESVTSSEFLFLKAIQRKRYATWLVSHSINVAIFTIKIGVSMKYDREKLTKLGLAALLHDVGMINVPNNIIFKHGRLTASEFAIIKQHPNYGYEIVKHLKSDYPNIVDVVLQEQEREDGSGYPQGLTGDKISEFAKVVGLADVFEALVHGRAYREGFITYNAIQKIIESRGKQFNAKIIRALINGVSMFPVGSMVKLSTDEIARVLSVNSQRPVRPVVEVLIDSDGNKIKNPIRLNLEEEPLIYIVKPLIES
ncbi:MAG: HD-GYP domain-containing protein [Candidatus Marinimicrobia bacterium]|nr:HD-GYP domain-containing protein [Candidatus Neomarinimicrobiota bacterium]MDD5061170.1 HD-GYP domain-containing protein [Candidatus Neomarinimicrobiota bacterium]